MTRRAALVRTFSTTWLVVGALAVLGAAQAPQLVMDIHQLPLQPNPSSDPDEFHEGLFAAFEPSVGREVFASSSHWDIRPGPANSNPREITSVRGVWVCSAHTASQGRELVVLDPSGAVTVVDIHRGVGSSNPARLTYFRNYVYFAAKSGPSNTELWRTDGTAAGTTRVLDIRVGPEGSTPRDLTPFGATLYFTADDGINGVEIWRTDGTAAGTRLEIETRPGAASSSPRSLTIAGGLLYFVWDDPVAGTELAQSDGTQAYLRTIGLNPGPGSSNPRELTPVGRDLFLLANRTQAVGALPHSEELWNVPTLGAAVRVRAFQWPAGQSAPGNLVGGVRGPDPAMTGTTEWLFLTAFVGGEFQVVGISREPPFPSRLFDFRVGGSANPRELTVLDEELFLAADNGVNGDELWRIHYLYAAPLLGLWTWEYYDLQPGPVGSSPAELAVMGVDTLFFRADDGVHGHEPWKGTYTVPTPPLPRTLSSALIADIHQASTSSNPSSLVDAHGVTYFVADDGVTGDELWKTNGTAAGTALVMDIRSGSEGSDPHSLTLLGNHLYFVADNGVHGAEPWVLDVLSGSVQMLADIRPGSASSDPDSLTVVDDGLLFAADDGVVGRELWRSNGTPAGTVLVLDIRPGVPGSNPRHLGARTLTALGRIALFSADDGTHGEELWRSNGVAGGTSLLMDINPGSASSIPFSLVRVGQTVWFTADNGTTGHELWRTGGTAASTTLAADIRAGSNGSNPVGLTGAGASSLFFFADDGVHGREVWSLGPSGPYMVADVMVGPMSSNPLYRTACGDRFFFTADDGIHGEELWVSDGTALGTQLTLDIWPGYTPSLPTHLFATGSRMVWFSAGDISGGLELWSSDGTAAGTQRVADLWPGLQSSSPSDFVLSRGTLLFSADHPLLGRELWRLDPGASVQVVGVGSARSTIAPTLIATDPVLGTTMNVTGTSPAGGLAAALMLSAPVPAALPLPIPGGVCYFHVDLAAMLTLGPVPVTTPGVWQQPIRIPNQPSLEGAPLALQAFWGPTASPLGIDLTNGVVLRLSAQ